MADVVANGVKFHVQRLVPKHAIPRTTVVFVHGLIIDNLSSFYYTLAGPVMDAGAEAFLYDLRGHGRSERPAHRLRPRRQRGRPGRPARRLRHRPPRLPAGQLLRRGRGRPDGDDPPRPGGRDHPGRGPLRHRRAGRRGRRTWPTPSPPAPCASSGTSCPQQAFKLSQRKFVKFLRTSDALLNGTSIITDLACGRLDRARRPAAHRVPGAGRLRRGVGADRGGRRPAGQRGRPHPRDLPRAWPTPSWPRPPTSCGRRPCDWLAARWDERTDARPAPGRGG